MRKLLAFNGSAKANSIANIINLFTFTFYFYSWFVFFKISNLR